MKIRVSIDTKDINFDDHNSVESGVFGIDKDGVYHSWYHSRTYLVPFTNIDIEDCKHECGFDKENKCFDCKMGEHCNLHPFCEECGV